jgi:hypothetical protein
MKAREPKPSLQGALTPEQFCRMFCLSPELYRALKRCRLAPREIRSGERIRLPLVSIAGSDPMICARAIGVPRSTVQDAS